MAQSKLDKVLILTLGAPNVSQVSTNDKQATPSEALAKPARRFAESG